MIRVCLTRLTEGPFIGPWDNVMQEAFYKALSAEKETFEVEKITGYPEPGKQYDILILCGVRLIFKRNLDVNRLRSHCKYLIDMGDYGNDPRSQHEDVYFYFNPSEKIHDHYVYLPKFVMEEELYPEHDEDEPLTIFVDHFKSQNNQEYQQSVDAINKVFLDIKNSTVPLRVFYPNSSGIEINPDEPEIPPQEVRQTVKYLPFKEIAKFYRRTHVFIPTHRETQGMVAQEIAACGGGTVMQHWMYPAQNHHQFRRIYYDMETEIDFSVLSELITKDSMIDNRNHALKECGFNNFKNKLCTVLKNL